jgi:DNA-binding beta-propeller fold protein YncE
MLKSAPPDLGVFLNGEALKPVKTAGGIRTFTVEPGPGKLNFAAPGYREIEYHTQEIPALLRDNILPVKLENSRGNLERLREMPTGKQPKSAFFSPLAGGRAGYRIIIPLLDEPGIDVFALSAAGEIRFEKRLAVPGSRARGFAEALIDERRREIWVSNMEENRVYIFDLDTLGYKDFAGTGGAMPKVIVQSPAGDITAVSNWLSQTVCLFDSQSRQRLALIPVGGTPRGMAFSPEGDLLYTAIFDEPRVAVIDMAAQKMTASYRLYEGEGAARSVLYSEGKLFVSDMYRGTVNILDAGTGRLLKSVRAGPNINTIVLSPGGKRLYVSSRGRNNPDDYTKPGPDFGAVYVLRTEDLSLEERVWGRNQPTGLAVSPDGKYQVFTDFLDANLELYRAAPGNE